MFRQFRRWAAIRAWLALTAARGLGVTLCVALPCAAVADEAPPVDVGPFDKSGPTDEGTPSAEAPLAPVEQEFADRTFTPEEQALLADATAKNTQVDELYDQGRYAEAIVLAE